MIFRLVITFFIIILITPSTFGSNQTSLITWANDIMGGRNNSASKNISNDFIEEFVAFLNKGKKNKIRYKSMPRKKMLVEMSKGNVDIVISETISKTIRYCIKYDFVPWLMLVPSNKLTNKFCDYIAISRNGELNSTQDLKNISLCVVGKYADIDFHIISQKLKEILKTTNLCEFVKKHHLYKNEVGFMMPNKRHSVIQSVLIHEADLAIVPRYDFNSYTELFPTISNKIKEVKWLNLDIRIPGFLVICKKTSFNKLKENWESMQKMHKTPAGNQFVISSGFEKFCSVPDSEFQQLTNFYKFLPATDNFEF